MEYTEIELIAKAKAFDQSVLAMIYDMYSTALFHYAYRQLGNQQLAEDCVADTFTRFLQGLKKGKGPQNNLRAYLYRIAQNWITDQFRRKQPVTDGLDEKFELIDSQHSSAEEVIMAALKAQQIRSYLKELSAEQRQVLVLKHLEELSNAEVAEIMEKSVGSVKALNSRGLANLRKMIDRKGVD